MIVVIRGTTPEQVFNGYLNGSGPFSQDIGYTPFTQMESDMVRLLEVLFPPTLPKPLESVETPHEPMDEGSVGKAQEMTGIEKVKRGIHN